MILTATRLKSGLRLAYCCRRRRDACLLRLLPTLSSICKQKLVRRVTGMADVPPEHARLRDAYSSSWQLHLVCAILKKIKGELLYMSVLT